MKNTTNTAQNPILKIFIYLITFRWIKDFFSCFKKQKSKVIAEQSNQASAPPPTKIIEKNSEQETEEKKEKLKNDLLESYKKIGETLRRSASCNLFTINVLQLQDDGIKPKSLPISLINSLKSENEPRSLPQCFNKETEESNTSQEESLSTPSSEIETEDEPRSLPLPNHIVPSISLWKEEIAFQKKSKTPPPSLTKHKKEITRNDAYELKKSFQEAFYPNKETPSIFLSASTE